MPSDDVRVAVGGTVDKTERCPACEQPMLYRVNAAGKIAETFCGYSSCSQWLKAKTWLKEVPCA